MRFLIHRLSIPALLLSGCADNNSATPKGGDAASNPADPSCPADGTIVHQLLDGGCVTGAACSLSVQFLCEPGVQYVTGLRQYACSCPTGTWSCTLTSSSLSLNPCDAGAGDAAAE